MEKGFFKVFSPERSSKRLKIPIAYTDYMNGELPMKVSLRDRFGNMWHIGVAKIGKDFYFQYGWDKFIEESTLEYGDFLIFDYDGNGVFDFKLLGHTCCEKEEARGLKEKEEEDEGIEEEEENDREITTCKKKEPHSKGRRVEEKEDDDDEYEEYEEEEEEEIEEEEKDETERAPRSKRIHVEEEDGDEEEEDEEETEEEKEEAEENAMAGVSKKEAPHSKAGCKRATVYKVRDQYGADIFKSRRATQPKNPYFVMKIRQKRKNQVYVPIDVVRDNKLEIPPTMIIRDSKGREFETKLKNWKDGRIWLRGGWRSLCRMNLVEKDDRCICEFVKAKSKKDLYLRVQVLYEGASSQPN
ncbi:B3 domain-containing protein At5g60140-like [Lycium barbarum]|uniref:B3 domain-containing protein At5g60140-like n=1 Tax=Lycium barbarum TaxID=112863 RepID=UPI00293EF5F5|nr:B3 domain-containing protein At5g60140-like [Lycium barbarum]